MTNGAFGSDLTQAPRSAGSSSGMTKYQRNICTSSGTLRNNSTYALATPTSHLFGRVRTVPITRPRIRAMIHAVPAVARVQIKPDHRVSMYVPTPSGDISQKMRQFQL